MKLIPLKGGLFAKVDDSDYNELMKVKWHPTSRSQKNIYARCSKGSMHRVILGLTDPKIIVDHKDHDGLNNQRDNIRACTHRENSFNRIPYGKSKYLGVYLHTTKRKKKKKIYISEWWTAAVTINKKQITVGRFKDQEAAARAYDKAAKKHYGEFANLNFKEQDA